MARNAAAQKPPAKRATAREVFAKVRAFFGKAFRSQSFAFNQTFFVTIFLLGFGLVMVLSSSSIDAIRANNDAFYMFTRQITFGALGFIGLAAASLMPAYFWIKNSNRFFVFALVLQLLPLVPGVGVNVNGNRSWVRLFAGFTLQPSEFLKIALILSMAEFMARRRAVADEGRLFAWPALARAAIAMFLIILGQDLGTTIVVAFIAFSLVWLGGAPSRHLRGPMILGAAVALPLLVFGASRLGRIQAWLNQSGNDSANNYAWQSVHGLWALAAGQVVGVGLGMSKLKWSWIPEVENDYIFAIIGEELGLLGSLMTVGMFALLGYSLIRIANRSRDGFARLVTIGVAVWITVQAFINIGVVIGVLPVLGVPLPLISYGGSSLIAELIAVGICLSFERENYALDGYATSPKSPKSKSARLKVAR